MVSAYSFISAIVFFNLALIIVYLMRHNTAFLVKYSTTALMLLLVLGVVRLLTPLDLKKAVVIPSVTVLPWMQRLTEKPIGSLNVGQWLLLLWAAGTAIVLVVRLREIILSWRDLRRIPSVDSPQVSRIRREFDLPERAVVVSPAIGTPQAAGLFTPHIYLPCLNLSDNELRWIFRHELIHIKEHDSWVKLFYVLIEAIFWWNPVVHIFHRELDNLIELRCDAKLAADIDDESKQEYLSTVLSVLKQITAAGDDCASGAQTFAKPGADVKQRFYFVLEHDEKTARVKKTVLLCSMLLCFALSYFVIVQPVSEPPVQDVADAFEITPDNAYFSLDEDGNYFLYVDGKFKWEMNTSDMQREPYCQLEIINGGNQ